MDAFKTKYLDPDYRKTPKTDFFCCACQRDLNPSRPCRQVYLVGNGLDVLHPSEWATYDPATDSTGHDLRGKYPIGNDCARKLGLEWTRPRPSSR